MVKAADIGSLIVLTPSMRGGRARISGTGSRDGGSSTGIS